MAGNSARDDEDAQVLVDSATDEGEQAGVEYGYADAALYQGARGTSREDRSRVHAAQHKGEDKTHQPTYAPSGHHRQQQREQHVGPQKRQPEQERVGLQSQYAYDTPRHGMEQLKGQPNPESPSSSAMPSSESSPAPLASQRHGAHRAHGATPGNERGGRMYAGDEDVSGGSTNMAAVSVQKKVKKKPLVTQLSSQSLAEGAVGASGADDDRQSRRESLLQHSRNHSELVVTHSAAESGVQGNHPAHPLALRFSSERFLASPRRKPVSMLQEELEHGAVQSRSHGLYSRMSSCLVMLEGGECVKIENLCEGCRVLGFRYVLIITIAHFLNESAKDQFEKSLQRSSPQLGKHPYFVIVVGSSPTKFIRSFTGQAALRNVQPKQMISEGISVSDYDPSTSAAVTADPTKLVYSYMIAYEASRMQTGSPSLPAATPASASAGVPPAAESESSFSPDDMADENPEHEYDGGPTSLRIPSEFSSTPGTKLVARLRSSDGFFSSREQASKGGAQSVDDADMEKEAAKGLRDRGNIAGRGRISSGTSNMGLRGREGLHIPGLPEMVSEPPGLESHAQVLAEDNIEPPDMSPSERAPLEMSSSFDASSLRSLRPRRSAQKRSYALDSFHPASIDLHELRQPGGANAGTRARVKRGVLLDDEAVDVGTGMFSNSPRTVSNVQAAAVRPLPKPESHESRSSGARSGTAHSPHLITQKFSQLCKLSDAGKRQYLSATILDLQTHEAENVMNQSMRF